MTWDAWFGSVRNGREWYCVEETIAFWSARLFRRVWSSFIKSFKSYSNGRREIFWEKLINLMKLGIVLGLDGMNWRNVFSEMISKKDAIQDVSSHPSENNRAIILALRDGHVEVCKLLIAGNLLRFFTPLFGEFEIARLIVGDERTKKYQYENTETRRLWSLDNNWTIRDKVVRLLADTSWSPSDRNNQAS